jgi:hypothetical protein
MLSPSLMPGVAPIVVRSRHVSVSDQQVPEHVDIVADLDKQAAVPVAFEHTLRDQDVPDVAVQPEPLGLVTAEYASAEHALLGVADLEPAAVPAAHGFPVVAFP